MKYALNLAADGRILSATFAKYASADAVLVDTLPDGNLSDYLYQDGQYIYAPIPDAEPSVEDQIAELKTALTETDYKIIKCSEYQLAGLELPYDISAVHEERQMLRDRINALESKEER